jgi:hypothetical protein
MKTAASRQTARFINKKRMHGFLSIEAMVVLTVVLILLGIAAARSDMLTGSSSAFEEVGNIQSLYASTKGLKTTTGYGAAGTDLVSQLIASNGVPKNMTVSGGQLYNSAGGTMSVVSTGAGFSVTTNGVARDSCIKQVTNISRGGAMATTQINSNSAISGEVGSSVASTQCVSGTNTIVWTSLT